ncbi:DNA circularization protein [Serratia marcescens]|uniref:DNA circularization protein n=1 Tax=Serratia marcescens TaxID=615 RepID=UPI0013DB9FD3|nr:DNA circularization N-terminal domain-containing protein [Serratia marcescens]
MVDIVHDLAGALGIDTLLPASFRGVEFDCLYTRDTLSRDTVAYEYPYRDGAEVEDQGMKAMNFRLSALFWGNRYQTELKAFLKTLKESGPGELVHPVYGSIPRVQFLEAGVEHEVEPLNAVTVELVFIEATTEQALFATIYPETSTDSLLDTVKKAFSDTMGWIKQAQDAMGRVSNIIASAEYVVQSLANEIQSTISSALNYLDYPAAFVSDLKTLLSAFTDRLDFNEVTRLTDWQAVRALGKQVITLQDNRFTVSQSADSGGVFVSTLHRASIMPQEDRDLVNQVVRLAVISEWVEVAADIMQYESETPTLSATDIERITNDVRSLIVEAIQVQRSMMATRQQQAQQALGVTQDISNDAAQIAELQAFAYTLQQLARGVILTLPPLVRREVKRACNLHLLAFEWYGDRSRAVELARLNPTLRNSNSLQPGDVLYAFAK